jgi:hypothetical protein
VCWIPISCLAREPLGQSLDFMAVTGNTRVLPQALEDTYATLRPRLTLKD